MDIVLYIYKLKNQKEVKKLLFIIPLFLLGCRGNNNELVPCEFECGCGICEMIDSFMYELSKTRRIQIDSCMWTNVHSRKYYHYEDSIRVLLMHDIDRCKDTTEVVKYAEACFESPKIRSFFMLDGEGLELFCTKLLWDEKYITFLRRMELMLDADTTCWTEPEKDPYYKLFNE